MLDKPLIMHSPEAAADLRILRDFLMKYSWRHYKVNRMTSKSKKDPYRPFSTLYRRGEFTAYRLAE